MSLPEIHLFDTETGTRRALAPLRAGHVGLYVCGVTVYDLSHIGHARVFVTFDIVTRYLRHRGYDVTYVRNHTDVDDKIIKRANERGIDPLDLAQEFINALDADMGALGCRRPTVEPRVSTHMEQIVAMIEALIARGHAYAVDGDVYFSVDSFPRYGRLSGTNLEANRAGERVAVDERKKNPFDFALWKAAKPGEPRWDSPWGPGRPGWHIECSAMSTTYLGPHFDIHGGGKDLVFPHHENEIAQSECATGHHYVNNWMHVGLVNIDGEKMSKSLNNFWTVRDVLAQHHPETVRAFFLSAHYRKPIAYSQANLELARHRVLYFYRTRAAIAALLGGLETAPTPDSAALDRMLGALHEGMDDDFNTPVALAVANEAARRANDILATKKLAKNATLVAELAAIDRFFDAFAECFGVMGSAPDAVLTAIRDQLCGQLGVDPADCERAIAERRAAREAKDWGRADAIRDELAARHVELMDTPEGTTWTMSPPAPDDEPTP
jgi:cysteinyl-tRNA synthetase